MTASTPEQEVWQLELASWNHLRAGDLDAYMSLFHEDVVGWPNNQAAPLNKAELRELNARITSGASSRFAKMPTSSSASCSATSWARAGARFCRPSSKVRANPSAWPRASIPVSRPAAPNCSKRPRQCPQNRQPPHPPPSADRIHRAAHNNLIAHVSFQAYKRSATAGPWSLNQPAAPSGGRNP